MMAMGRGERGHLPSMPNRCFDGENGAELQVTASAYTSPLVCLLKAFDMTRVKPWFAVVAIFLCSCITKKQRPIENQSPSVDVKSSMVALEDCAHVRQVICQTAGEKSVECKSAANTLALLPSSACTAASGDDKGIESRIRVLREPCITLANRLCEDLGSERESCDAVKDQTPQFSVERCNLMLQRYADVIMELRKLADTKRPLTLPEQSLIAQGNRPSFGPLDAKVVVVEFSDFQCPFCLTTAVTVHEIRAKFERQVRFVFRQFPLSIHAQAHLAAEAALAAHSQGKFWELHDLLFAHQKALQRSDIEVYAASIGLNLVAFRKGLDQRSFNTEVDEDIAIGNQVHVQGTPTMFINGRRVPNPSDAPAVLNAIHEALILEFSRRKSNQALNG